jgi:acyl-coenzyme A synthetase/AMP-(fatty) acid ligase
VIAFVVPAEGRTPDPERLVAHCAVALGAVAAPVEVHVVDSLPQTESGKVAKGELRARVAREDR